MSSFKLLASAGLFAIAALAQPASALTFTFTNQAQGGAEQGTAARRSFEVAAAYWSSVLTNNANVNIAIGFYSLGAGNEDVLGSAGSSIGLTSVNQFKNTIQATSSSSGVDALVRANLPATSASGGVSMITPGYVDETNKLGIDTSKRVWDTDNTTNNTTIYGTRANLKALGLIAANATATDASIQFNSDFQFDFDPRDGIDADKVDFTLVALHEIGHALGFVSGVDDYDYFGGPSGPCFNGGTGCGITGRTYDANGDYWASTLDLFRYSTDADNVAPGTNPVLDWSVRNPSDPVAYPDRTANPYFSLDGGTTMGLAGEETYFSRGQFNGASYQASHWRISGANNGAGNPTQPFIGIMDPVGRTGNYVTALDIAAFDAIGWNSTIDALNDRGYARTTAQIFSQFATGDVPEPATWAQMLLGFGLLGFAIRRKARVTAVTA